jgi:hypothetical protein
VIEFEAAAERLRTLLPEVGLGKVDATKNEIAGYAFSKYPALVFYPVGGVAEIVYTESNDAEGIIRFVKSSAE